MTAETPPPLAEPGRQLAILGFDAMDAELVRRWAAEGHLPAFRRLLASGAWCEWLDPPEHSSGTVWTSLNTGLGPLRHDLFFATRVCRGSYRTRLGRADDVTAEPFWAWLARVGRRLALFDVPFSIPREEYGGVQVLGWCQHDRPWRPCSVPRDVLRRLRARFPPHPVPDCHDYTTETGSLRRFRDGLVEGLRGRTAVIRALMAERPWDLLYATYSEPHCAGHLMWHLEDEAHPRFDARERAVLGHPLRDVYAAADAALAELLAAAPPATTFAVVLSHGMGPNYRADHLFPAFLERFNRWWEESGAAGEASAGERAGEAGDEGVAGCATRARGSAAAAPPAPAAAAPGGGAADALWRATVGRLPLGWRDAAKRRLPIGLRAWIGMRRWHDPRRAARMPAFPIPQDGFSSLRVNLAGREPAGRIRPGDEYRRYLDALVAELGRLVNAATGTPAVARVFRADAQVDPLAIRGGTDLLVWWSKAHPIPALASPRFGRLEAAHAEVRTGEHVMRGMLLVAGPGVRPGRADVPGMTVLDLAPTFSALAGVEPPAGLPGRSRCAALLDPARPTVPE